MLRRYMKCYPYLPMMGPYARLQSEKIARQRGRDCVTADVVKETEKIYADFIGAEKTGQLKAFISTAPAPTLKMNSFSKIPGPFTTLMSAIQSMARTAPW